MSQQSAVQWFRSSAPYIHAHRGSTFVIVFGGELVASRRLRALAQDLALIHALGVRLVLVPGARPQIDRRIVAAGGSARYEAGLRLTDELALECVKDAVGSVRVEMESLLSMGLPNSSMAGARIRVATGNFVMARPIGVVDGVDFMYTGQVRRIDGEGIRQRLDSGAIVLLSPIGYSVVGETFNVGSDEVAAETAVALGADKLVCLVDTQAPSKGRRALGSELSLDAAERRLAGGRLSPEHARHLRAAVRACRGGVRRAHLVGGRVDGSLLAELFTREGSGTLVSAESFEDIRKARFNDVAGILELLRPLEEAGLLVRRSQEHLEMELEHFFVVERDGLIAGCGALIPYSDAKSAEIACLAIHPDYRASGRGDRLLQVLERQALSQGIVRLFALTTRTSHWFRERGFVPASPRALPKTRRQFYDPKRRSKILTKNLTV